MSQHYLPGCICGYLTVQTGSQNDVKRKKMFVVLSDSRMDYYELDPRPEFEIPVTETYVFLPITHVNHYVELNSQAPPLSFCLTTDKCTRVLIADSEQDLHIWFNGIKDRLDALMTMLTGQLMIRKEVPVNKQMTRFWLSSKYKWKVRYVELGRGSIRYCTNIPQSKRTTTPITSSSKMMKQFPLTSISYVMEEEMEQLERLVHDPSTAVAKSPRRGSATPTHQLSYTERVQREQSSFFPFTVCTGPTHLVLATQTRALRSEWVLAIRFRIIGLKYRGPNGITATVNGNATPNVPSIQLQGFMEVQKPHTVKWKKRFVELDNGMLKVKTSERKVGSIMEMALIPTCVVVPTLVRANAFSVRNLGQQICIATTSSKDTDHWMKCIKKVATGIDPARYEKIFEEEVLHILGHSKYHKVVVQTVGKAGLVLEKYQKRVFVLSHAPEGSVVQMPTSTAAESPTSASTALTNPNVMVPEGSVLINICEHEINYDTFENIWHNVRQRKGRIRPMKLTFRAPIERTGFLEVKIRLKADWQLYKIILANGKIRFEPLHEPDMPSLFQDNEQFTVEIPLRLAMVELLDHEEYSASNCMRVTADDYPPVLMNAFSDDDLYLWFVLLHLEICIAKVDVRFPIPPKKPSTTLSRLTESRNPQLALRPYIKCLVRGKSLAVTEKNADQCAERLIQSRRSSTVNQTTTSELVAVSVGTDPLQISPEPATTPAQVDLRMVDSVDGSGPSESSLKKSEPRPSNTVDSHTHINHANLVQRRSSTRDGFSILRPVVPLTESELKSLFQLLDFAECGKISSLVCWTTLESLTRHLMPDSALWLARFLHDLHNLRPSAKVHNNFLIKDHEFNQLFQSTVDDSRVLQVLRKYINGQIQWL